MAQLPALRSRFTLAAIGAVILAVSTARAQDYKSLDPSVTEAQSKQVSGQVANVLRGAGAPDAAGQKALQQYFMGYLYPSMTSYDALALGQLSEKREALFQRFINAAKSPQARDLVIGHTLKAMTAIAKGNYHPAVRYNAVLILGQLDAQANAKPLPAGTEAVLSFLENDEFNKVPVPTALKIAALVSLQRQVRLGVDPAMAERITKAAQAVANREDLPEDATAKAYGWVRRQAAAVLALQFEKGLTPPVHQTFVRLIRDEKSELDDRCSVAQLLKPTMFAGAQGLNVQDLGLALGDLARDVMAVEGDEAEDYLNEVVPEGGGAMPAFGGEGGGFGGRGAFGGREGGFGGGAFGGGAFGGRGFGGEGGVNPMMEQQGPTFEKRRMIDRTLAVANGLQAVAEGSPDELKQRLTELSTMIAQVAENAAPDKATIDEIAVAVSQLREDVERIVTAWAPAAAPADEVIEEEAAPAAAEGAEQPAPAAAAPAEAAG